MRILINTISTKKHSGGAFQVAQNFLNKTIEHKDIEWGYVVSMDLHNVLPEQIKTSPFYFVFPTQPDFFHSYLRVKKELHALENKFKPDVVYSITAPSYFSFMSPEVMRFTNPWVTHPNKYAWSVLSLKEKIVYYLYGLNQKRMMKDAHYFITQTETCAEGIKKVTGESSSHVKVVPNVLPAVFKSFDNTHISEDKLIHIACVGAATTHKNFDIIPDVLNELRAHGMGNVRIHVTLPSDEPTLGIVMKKILQYNLDDMFVNHGRLSQKELGEMYRRCQFSFLPTLLEVFSASTIESMYFNLPIVATDFPFNKEVLADSCLYYKPKNATEAAGRLMELITNTNLQEELKSKMQARLALYGDYDAHFDAIKDFLMKVGNNKL